MSHNYLEKINTTCSLLSGTFHSFQSSRDKYQQSEAHQKLIMSPSLAMLQGQREYFSFYLPRKLPGNCPLPGCTLQMFVKNMPPMNTTDGPGTRTMQAIVAIIKVINYYNYCNYYSILFEDFYSPFCLQAFKSRPACHHLVSFLGKN